jgi:thiamine-monophosphate kinase
MSNVMTSTIASRQSTIAGVSESAFIERLRTSARPDTRVRIHIGDDLAALAWNSADLLLVGADQVLEGVHFDLARHGPRAVGRKAVNRNLSDCAAMACVPVAATCTLALPRGAGESLAAELVEGMRDALGAFNAVLVGGDTGSWAGPLAISVAIFGRSAGLKPVERRGARVGDRLFVTGPLGGSILGRHLNFVPRVDWAIELAARHDLHAMIDLSDGLSRDLPRLCDASGVGAMIDAALVPIHDDARRMASGSPLEHALHDGEDYELLFAAERCDHPHAIEIGQITATPGVWIRDGTSAKPVAAQGWEHSL